MYFHWLAVTCIVWASLSSATPEESGESWKESKCDFVNHQMECIPCSITRVEPRSDNPIPEGPRSPPEKPREVTAFLYANGRNNSSGLWEYEGISFIIKQPFTTVTLTGYFIDIDMSRKDGIVYLIPSYRFNVIFRELHYDDPPIKVDVPLTTIFESINDETPVEWLERSLKILVCSMPPLKATEEGNCFLIKPFYSPARNLALFNHTQARKEYGYAPPCKYRTSTSAMEDPRPSDDHEATALSPFRVLIIVVGAAFVICVFILVAVAWRQFRKNGKIKSIQVVLVREPPPNPPPPNIPEDQCAACKEERLDVTNRQGSKSMSTWESGNEIHHLLGRNTIAVSGNGRKGFVSDNSGFVQHYKFDNTSLDLVQEQQGPRQHQGGETCDAEIYDSTSGSCVSRASACFVDHSSPV